MMQKRDQLILQYVNQKGKVSVVELSEMLSVAVETIRRDLTALENKGLLHRIHGAAVTCKTNDLGSSFQYRQKNNADAKKAIAKNALEYLFEGAIVGLDASSTSWHFAQMLPDIPCTVVTNSLHGSDKFHAQYHGVNEQKQHHHYRNRRHVFREIRCLLWAVVGTTFKTATHRFRYILLQWH